MTFFSHITTNGATALDLSDVEVLGAPVSPAELARMVEEVADYQEEQLQVALVHRSAEQQRLHRLGMCDGRCEKPMRFSLGRLTPTHERAQMLCDCPLTEDELDAAEDQSLGYEREQRLLLVAHPDAEQRRLHAHNECDGTCARFSIFR